MTDLVFVNHHNHSHVSINDCIVKVEDLVKKAIDLKSKSVTITDHGTLGGTYTLWNECKKAKKTLNYDIKPILGVEGYYVDDYSAPESEVPWNYAHIILLAKTEEGWRNLKIIQSKAWEEGYHKKPRIDFNLLKQFGKGIICTSACIRGLVGWNYFTNKDLYFREKSSKFRKNLIKERIHRFKDIFGDDLYLELHYSEAEEQRILNEYILAVSERSDGKLIAANDCHYLNKKDWYYHDIMICHARKQNLDDPHNDVYSHFTKQLYAKTAKGMRKAWTKWHQYLTENDFNQSIMNTVEIQSKVEHFELKPKMVCLPDYSKNATKDMYDWVMEGWKTRLTKEQQESQEYKDRLKYECEVFAKLKMENYMLVCADIIRRAKKEKIPCGPGRGSVCGSLVAFCMEISQIDPIKFKTSFDRFLIASRLSLPDIDMDFGKEGRNRIKEIVKELYGADKFAAIVTYQDWKPRGLIKDIGKVLGRPYAEMNEVTKKIDDKTKKFDDEEAPLPPEIVEWLEDNKDIYKPAQKLQGTYRARGVHASGMLLTPTKLEDWVPVSYMIERDSEDKKPIKVSEWDMYAVEDLNILKIDFLGLISLDVIKTACELIGKFDVDQLWQKVLNDLENPKVYEMLCAGHLLGIFQMETSEGMLELTKRMQPICFHDIDLIISMYRTAVIQAGMMDEYINRRNGEDFEYIHEKAIPALKDTLGVMIYQEQLMQIAVDVGGFSPQESDNFRKATKLKDPEKFKPWKDQFVNGCKKNGLTDEEGEKLWDWCYQFSGYGFNRSHSAAYALITYASAYLKVFYPTEYMTAIMTWNSKDDKMMAKYLQEAKRLGIKMRTPKINSSGRQFKMIKEKKILYPFTIIKRAGEKAVNTIIDERKQDGKFDSFIDFYDRINKTVVNVGVMTNLILSGAFNSLEGKEVEEIFDSYMNMRGKDQTHRQVYCKDCKTRFPCAIKKDSEDQHFCPSCGGTEIDFSFEACAGKKFNKAYVYSQVYGFNAGENPLKQYVNQISKYKAEPLTTLDEMDDGQALTTAVFVKNIKKHIDKNQNEMAFIDVTDGEMDCSLTIFASDWETLQKEFKTNCCYVVKAFKNRGNNLLYSTRGKIKSKLIRLGV